ncbi:MAG: DNA mismatch repair endonuclease MutL [Longicatena sp.]
MGVINRLDEHLSNMIAAGEVVERPSGIVKELVENCIDAKARNIEIQILQGGIDTITIIDDGSGMDASDATKAFERHATSKLKEVDDLWNIHTMGFRGEALPSIASVSHVLLRTSNGIDATEVEIKYGTLVSAKPAGTPKGTMIQVKNLFQKTPARFKHLKTPQYEFSLISDVIQKFSLSHPDIGFCLSHDGRTVFKTKGNGNLLEVLMQIYGRESAKTAIALDGKDNDYKIEGYAMQPQFNRATKYYILLYINGRMIRNYHLQKAVIDAYAPYMPKDRYPIIVMNLMMDAQLVDVNVHPSKWEIRLSKEKQLEKLVYETLRLALQKQLEVPTLAIQKEIEKEKIEEQELVFTYARDTQTKVLHEEVNKSFTEPAPLDMKELGEQIATLQNTPKEPISIPKQTFTKEIVQEDENKYQGEQAATLLKEVVQTQPLIYEKKETVNEVKALNPSLPQLRVIGQFHTCYILAEGEKGLYIIDQHAAQERYHYEIIRNKIMNGNIDSQPLLLPVTIESSVSAIAQIQDLNALLEQLGIHLEAFGDATFICRSLPIWMKDVEEAAFIIDMIDIWEKDKEISLDKLRKHAIATMACHSSIRFNRTLTLDEMKQVVLDLGKCEQPFHCPHGRPTLICIDDKQLIKEFERG